MIITERSAKWRIMEKVRNKNLLLLMTPGIGLNTWKNIGILNRELAPYKEYINQGWVVTIATYDKDLSIVDLPPQFNIVKLWHHRLLFSTPWTLRKAIKWADVVKTNQSVRSWWYVLAAKLMKKPIVLRSGWLPGLYREDSEGYSLSLMIYRKMEGWAFRNATVCQVATERDKSWIIRNYGVHESKILIKPNFIDIELFKPVKNVKAIPRSVISIGRLDKVKRYDLLIEACSLANVSRLTIIGEGIERPNLEFLASSLNVDLSLPGRVDQIKLPEYLAKSEIFSLTSAVEGHPKALLEAMACGIPCVGTKTPGISNLVEHQSTGYLCDSTPASIAESFTRLFENKHLRNIISKNATEYIYSNFESKNVIKIDIELAEALRIGKG